MIVRGGDSDKMISVGDTERDVGKVAYACNAWRLAYVRLDASHPGSR